MNQLRPCSSGPARSQRGLALVFVLIMMSIATAIALVAARITLQSDRGARNDRDRQVAFQSAELALQDARDDIMSPRIAGGRGCLFGKSLYVSEGCQADSVARGVCAYNPTVSNPPPMYKQVDWEDTSTARAYANYGEFTNRNGSLQTGTFGAPAKAPKYIIVDESADLRIYVASLKGVLNKEELRRLGADMGGYRVYALGYGPSAATQVLLEAVILKPQLSNQCTS